MITCCNVFNGWPKTTLLFPVWPRDAEVGHPGMRWETWTRFLPPSRWPKPSLRPALLVGATAASHSHSQRPPLPTFRPSRDFPGDVSAPICAPRTPACLLCGHFTLVMSPPHPMPLPLVLGHHPGRSCCSALFISMHREGPREMFGE